MRSRSLNKCRPHFLLCQRDCYRDQLDNLCKSPWTPPVYSKCSLDISLENIIFSAVVFLPGSQNTFLLRNNKRYGALPSGVLCSMFPSIAISTMDGASAQFPTSGIPFPTNTRSPDFLSTFPELETFPRKPTNALGQDLLRKARLLLRQNDHKAGQGSWWPFGATCSTGLGFDLGFTRALAGKDLKEHQEQSSYLTAENFRPRNLRWLPQGHTAAKWQSYD